METLGVWETVEDRSMPLEIMKIIDASGAQNGDQIKSQKEFNSSEISDSPFGWNVKNSLMRAELKRLIDHQSNCELINATSAIDFISRDNAAFVKISSGHTVKAKLVIEADRKSVV